MGYDYSIDFLRRNDKIVKMIDEAYKDECVFSMNVESAHELTVQQRLINNVIYSLAVNDPAMYMDVRKKIRTWTDPKHTGKFTLYVGPGWSKMPGRRPGTSSSTEFSRRLESQTTIEKVYHYPTRIETVEDMIAVTGKILELPPATLQVSMEFTEEPDPAYFTDLFAEHGWHVLTNGPTNLTLERDNVHT